MDLPPFLAQKVRLKIHRMDEINPNLLHRWRRDFQQVPEHAFPGLGKKRADENQVATGSGNGCNRNTRI